MATIDWTDLLHMGTVDASIIKDFSSRHAPGFSYSLPRNWSFDLTLQNIPTALPKLNGFVLVYLQNEDPATSTAFSNYWKKFQLVDNKFLESEDTKIVVDSQGLVTTKYAKVLWMPNPGTGVCDLTLIGQITY
jgi:hypothetical protein